MSAVRRGSPPPSETPGGSHRGASYAQFPKINIDHGDTWRLQLINYRSRTERTANALSDSPLPSLSQLKILAPILVAPWLYASVATALA